MFTTPVHIIDFEGSRQSGVVEYGIVTVVGQEITSTYTRICAPEGAIADVDRLQHGISEDRARGEALFSTEWPMISRLRSEGPFCAHNAVVESGLIQGVWARPKSSPNFAEPGAMVADWGPWLDTLYLYRRIYAGLESYRLQELVETFALQSVLDGKATAFCPKDRRKYHCALYDALASALLFARLFDETELKEATLPWLMMQSVSSESTRHSMEQQELL